MKILLIHAQLGSSMFKKDLEQDFEKLGHTLVGTYDCVLATEFLRKIAFDIVLIVPEEKRFDRAYMSERDNFSGLSLAIAMRVMHNNIPVVIIKNSDNEDSNIFKILKTSSAHKVFIYNDALVDAFSDGDYPKIVKIFEKKLNLGSKVRLGKIQTRRAEVQ